MVDILREALAPFTTHIDWAFIYGSVARAEALATSDVDLLIIGEVGLADLSRALRHAEARLSRAINPTLYSREEFDTKRRARDHFLTSVLDGATLCILGNRHELAATPPQSPGADTRHKSQRT